MRFEGVIGAALLGSSALQHVAAAMQSDLEGDIVSAEHLETRQTTGTIAVTGVTGNGVQPRLELRTMQQQYPDMFNVFLLGLARFKAMSQSDPLSYYQIAGIHGRPYVPWDGIGVAPGYGGGYCTHTSNLFLPWHRPYLALLEQEIYKHVQAAAQSFPAGATRDKYVSAARNWRFPYWDWAAAPCSGCKAFPALISDQWATVTTPTGVQTIANPLFRYDFHPVSVSDMVYNPFASWDVTKRYPTSWDASASSQNNLLNPIFQQNQPNFRDRLYNLFTGYSNFSQFGDAAWISSTTTNADSLESLHDGIHSMVGNNGHMTYLDYAAFDPVFWLHHTMVDRSFALWQAIHPDSYVEPLAAVGGTFTYAAGTVNDQNSALTPFFKDSAGTNWTSAGVRSTTTFGYTYPELQNGATAASVRAAINKLYGNTTTTSAVSSSTSAVKSAASVPAKIPTNSRTSSSSSNRVKLNIWSPWWKRDNMTSADQPFYGTNGTNSTDGYEHEYVCNIVSQKFALNGSYAVYILLGDVSTNSTAGLQVSPNLVGTHSIFSSMPSDDNPMMNMDLKVTGTVPLTSALVEKYENGELRSLNPSDVEAYLAKNLQWRVSMYDGREIAVAQVPDLSVAVVEAQVIPAASEDEFPQWGPFTALTGVTAGKAGGYSAQYWSCPEDGSSFANTYSGSSSSNSATPQSTNPPAINAAAPFGNGTATTSAAPQGTAAGTGSVVPMSTYTGAASVLSMSGYAVALAAAALLV